MIYFRKLLNRWKVVLDDLKIVWNVNKNTKVVDNWDKFEYNNSMICENEKKQSLIINALIAKQT